MFELPAVAGEGPAPWSSGWPFDGDVDAVVDDTPDEPDVPDDGSGVIGATLPELAVVVDGADVLDAVAGCVVSGGVSVGPLKLIGCSPASICGVTT